MPVYILIENRFHGGHKIVKILSRLELAIVAAEQHMAKKEGWEEYEDEVVCPVARMWRNEPCECNLFIEAHPVGFMTPEEARRTEFG